MEEHGKRLPVRQSPLTAAHRWCQITRTGWERAIWSTADAGGGDCSPIRVSMTDDQKDTVIINTVTVYEDREQNRWVHDRTMQFHSL